VKTRYTNGLGIVILMTIMAVTPLIPHAAMSAAEPHWVWDEDGKVSDSNGVYRTLSEDEACAMYGLCKKVQPRYASSSSGDSGPGAGGSDGDPGGCL
jgi:hypothetical protein